MKTRKTDIFVVSFVLILLLFVSCGREHNQAVLIQLQRWDALLEEQPQNIKDSLLTLNFHRLSRANRAYYGLLKTISDDKTYTDFTSDSLINNVQNYFNRHEKGSDNHIRSLAYLGIVRYRMGNKDSTVFTPMKEGEQLYLKQKQPNPNTGNMLYYYLGDLLSHNNDFRSADKYFNKALQLAKQRKKSVHIFDAYLALFWNKMEQKRYDCGKLYLDSLNEVTDLSPDQQYRLLTSRSLYHEIENDFEKELDCEKAKLPLVPHLKEPIQLFRLYYALSDAYAHNNLLDSAMYHAYTAITYIRDSTNKLNYLLYGNVADIAKKQQNLSLALEYKDKAFKEYSKSIHSRLNTQVLELEKRYNLSESENIALKAERNKHIWFMVSIITLLLLMLLILYAFKQRSITKLKEHEAAEIISRIQAEEKEATERGLRLEAENRQIEAQTARQQKMMEISVQFLSEYSALKEKAREMTNKIRAKESKLGDDYDLIFKEGQDRFNYLAHHLFSEDDFKEQFNIHQDLDVFSQSDRLFLIMLSVGASNIQIAAMLNTTVHNLKTRKSYLKTKIEKNATSQNNFSKLLPLFTK